MEEIFTLTGELDLVLDAVRDVQRIHALLTKRHGDAFRALERRIDALSEMADWGEWGQADLEPGRFVLFVPAALAQIIADARSLGVLT